MIITINKKQVQVQLCLFGFNLTYIFHRVIMYYETFQRKKLTTVSACVCALVCIDYVCKRHNTVS